LRNCFRVTFASAIFALSSVVLLAGVQAPAHASITTPVPILDPFVEVVSNGNRLTNLCRAAGQTGCIVAAGVGSYEGTCWVLGQVYANPDGCSEGVDTIFRYVADAITGGDDRSVSNGYLGADAITGVVGYAGAVDAWTANWFFAGTTSGMGIRYATTTGGVCLMTINRSFGGTTKTVNFDTSGFTNGDGNPTDDAQALRSQMATALGVSTGSITDGCSVAIGTGDVYVTAVQLRQWNSPFTLQSEYVLDPGIGTPWDISSEFTCVRPNGTEFTVSNSITYTPVAGLTSGDLTMTPCWVMEAGSKLKAQRLQGDRDSISPAEEVDVEIGTSTETNELYPLCTTDAPAGGCFLDLRRGDRSCFTNGVYCAAWPENIERWDMTCEWGPYAVAIEVCTERYGTLWDGQVQTDPNAEPEGSTGFPNSGTNPTTPRTEPSTSTNPDTADCFGEAWGWNPVDWIYIPVKCSLIWAFVPTDFPAFTAIDSPLPEGWLPSLPGIAEGSCGVLTLPSISLGPLMDSTGSMTLVDTCDAPWPLVRGVVYYGLLTVGLVIAGTRGFAAATTALGMNVDTGTSGDD